MTRLHDGLARILGPFRAPRFLAEELARLGLVAVVTPDDLYRLGDALCRRSNDVAVVGHAAKMDALLLGARPTVELRRAA